MAIDIKGLKEFVKLAKDTGASELIYETKTIKIKVAFGEVVKVHPIANPSVSTQQSISTLAQASIPKPNVKKEDNDNGLIHTVKSPFVGTFYSSAAPGKPTYVKLGDHVKVGQVLCVLEAMKIMNEIDTDVSGEIIEVCVENESLVEFGQDLFKIRLK